MPELRVLETYTAELAESLTLHVRLDLLVVDGFAGERLPQVPATRLADERMDSAGRGGDGLPRQRLDAAPASLHDEHQPIDYVGRATQRNGSRVDGRSPSGQ